ncbi:MAG TPA: STAS-like domain-containing protein, partial [Nitrospirota bacterium]
RYREWRTYGCVRDMIKYDLYKILKEELGNGSKDLVTRPSGQAVRERVERELEKLPAGKVAVLDFSKIGVIDYSCADEIIAKLVSRLLGGEYGDKYLVLAGLNESQRENIEVALERKDLAVIGVMRDDSRVVLGSLHNYLKDTLDFITARRRATAKDLSDAKKVEPNTSGTRLLNLHKKRLVKRAEETRSDGKVWIYELL